MNINIYSIPKKSQQTITNEWDRIAPIRDVQLSNNEDRSFESVLKPWILGHLGNPQSILDVGCGTGHMTTEFEKMAPKVTGIDPSSASIRIARSQHTSIEYEICSVEDWASSHGESTYDLVVANMVLMDTLDLDGVCTALAQLGRGGRLLATITHPAFWPIYWEYFQHSRFDYSEELLIEAPFRTSSMDYGAITTHIHRPLATYLEVLRRKHIQITHIEEMRGIEPVKRFPFPRFLGIEAKIPSF
ncbi:class I SAM-dependent methyltransferase [Kocuria palustris]|jgi:predicted TPR repeat methyltransferase|uniref:class I SAM-dependent methyltransferase n=1 Tax=Kocuria palustris TaxID=71999 RepID=UPI0019CF8128|nr:class I SAM-dependent methyltransferase [Kocuria palustris]MBN6753356.1 class I SAM-dependent methyltransferase [Kocuria palustris]MBN6758129.1 class I SAM-dependent methyltransferase [Kocuria palustris]MBN6763157.1 class I SAM-dependent methyltransferase [Kocuria palustris]MBN6782861.1 class I SAM-dependent methyltransferase [Kocuria palustris]MBN6798998.1 class I SAM-dependent methyltransferase [Kocuria palustris]